MMLKPETINENIHVFNYIKYKAFLKITKILQLRLKKTPGEKDLQHMC
jgi:hypothetical protein